MPADGQSPDRGLSVHENVVAILDVSVDRVALLERYVWVPDLIPLAVWFEYEFGSRIHVLAVFEEPHESVNVV